ncbi:MAG: hypothetical protein ACUVTZ_00615 [Armatimonadota bacterium]
MPVWEYKLIRIHRVSWEDTVTREPLGRREDTAEVFNALGKDGWELVGMGFDATGDVFSAAFKRPAVPGAASSSEGGSVGSDQR